MKINPKCFSKNQHQITYTLICKKTFEKYKIGTYHKHSQIKEVDKKNKNCYFIFYIKNILDTLFYNIEIVIIFPVILRKDKAS